MKPAEDYILKQIEPFKSILIQVQVLIEQTLPVYNLQYKWRLPFYFSEGCPICYLNVTKGYVDVCFWLSDDFAIIHPSLVSEKRKHVKSLRYLAINDIQPPLLTTCINEAFKTREKGFKMRR